ncbi:hypothetical protein CYMTET_47460 [Cymbomonas tetramitiformis]|uniref:Uncharacterized protein n=1 Tax=Cymbomonas tetramitiformis TaxID=36881 RepID=A0AAE0BVZ0_9CHLO|nr:hypothetical protein CYMTET_47460 [Cymbomonas tetramitiformis]
MLKTNSVFLAFFVAINGLFFFKLDLPILSEEMNADAVAEETCDGDFVFSETEWQQSPAVFGKDNKALQSCRKNSFAKCLHPVDIPTRPAIVAKCFETSSVLFAPNCSVPRVYPGVSLAADGADRIVAVIQTRPRSSQPSRVLLRSSVNGGKNWTAAFWVDETLQPSNTPVGVDVPGQPHEGSTPPLRLLLQDSDQMGTATHSAASKKKKEIKGSKAAISGLGMGLGGVQGLPEDSPPNPTVEALETFNALQQMEESSALRRQSQWAPQLFMSGPRQLAIIMGVPSACDAGDSVRGPQRSAAPRGFEGAAWALVGPTTSLQHARLSSSARTHRHGKVVAGVDDWLRGLKVGWRWQHMKGVDDGCQGLKVICGGVDDGWRG